jgi:uncharacterized protein (DUF3084 family)
MTDVAPTLTSLVDHHVRTLASLVDQLQMRDRDATTKVEPLRAITDVPTLTSLVGQHICTLTSLVDQMHTRDRDQTARIERLQRAIEELATDLADVRQRVEQLERKEAPAQATDVQHLKELAKEVGDVTPRGEEIRHLVSAVQALG